MKNVIYEIKHYILNICIKYIRWYSKDSSYIKHANKEYKLAWPDKDCMQDFMCQQVNDLLALLSIQGDSGCSIEYKLDLFTRMAKFEIIGKLTFKDDEFGDIVDSYTGSKQNKRLSSVFSYPDGSFSYVDDFIKRENWYIGEENIIKERSIKHCYSGWVFVITKDKQIYQLKRGRIKDINKFIAKPIYVNVYTLEYPKDWWIMFCKEDDLKEYLSRYNPILGNNDSFNKELDFKDGIYKDKILKRIDTIYNHMYNN